MVASMDEMSVVSMVDVWDVGRVVVMVDVRVVEMVAWQVDLQACLWVDGWADVWVVQMDVMLVDDWVDVQV